MPKKRSNSSPRHKARREAILVPPHISQREQCIVDYYRSQEDHSRWSLGEGEEIVENLLVYGFASAALVVLANGVLGLGLLAGLVCFVGVPAAWIVRNCLTREMTLADVKAKVPDVVALDEVTGPGAEVLREIADTYGEARQRAQGSDTARTLGLFDDLDDTTLDDLLWDARQDVALSEEITRLYGHSGAHARAAQQACERLEDALRSARAYSEAVDEAVRQDQESSLRVLTELEVLPGGEGGHLRSLE